MTGRIRAVCAETLHFLGCAGWLGPGKAQLHISAVHSGSDRHRVERFMAFLQLSRIKFSPSNPEWRSGYLNTGQCHRNVFGKMQGSSRQRRMVMRDPPSAILHLEINSNAQETS